jgi:hypothetical protein
LRAAGAAARVEQGNASLPAQSTAPAVDAFAPPRDLAVVHGAMHALSGNAVTSAGSTPGSAAGETFAALDADLGSPAPAWIHAGTQRAEAGFQDPSLGWVGVRADLSGGTVHAALLPGSDEAAQALGGHMAGLSAYLAEEHSPVQTLTMLAPESPGTGLGANQSMGQGTGQGSYAEPQSSPQPGAPTLTAATTAEVLMQTGRPEAIALPPRPEGTHISVMA